MQIDEISVVGDLVWVRMMPLWTKTLRSHRQMVRRHPPRVGTTLDAKNQETANSGVPLSSPEIRDLQSIQEILEGCTLGIDEPPNISEPVIILNGHSKGVTKPSNIVVPPPFARGKYCSGGVF